MGRRPPPPDLERLARITATETREGDPAWRMELPRSGALESLDDLPDNVVERVYGPDALERRGRLSPSPPEGSGRHRPPAPAVVSLPSRLVGATWQPRWTAVLALLLVLVLAGVAGWELWRRSARLDTIEARVLTWSNVQTLATQHVVLTAVSALIVVGLAVPIGILLTRPGLRRFSAPVVAFANAGQAAPVIGLIVLLAMWLGFGFWTAVLALSIYAFLPVLQNTITGLRGVDPTLVEAARGVGMSQLATLVRIELPLAVPVIMNGVRTALVLLVGTASFATFIDAGGLGSLITTGINLFRYPILVSGAVLVALLALLVDWVGRVLETLTTPRGL